MQMEQPSKDFFTFLSHDNLTLIAQWEEKESVS